MLLLAFDSLGYLCSSLGLQDLLSPCPDRADFRGTSAPKGEDVPEKPESRAFCIVMIPINYGTKST